MLAEVIAQQHRFGYLAVVALIKARVNAVAFGHAPRFVDATAFTVALLTELRPMVSGDAVRAAARVARGDETIISERRNRPETDPLIYRGSKPELINEKPNYDRERKNQASRGARAEQLER